MIGAQAPSEKLITDKFLPEDFKNVIENILRPHNIKKWRGVCWCIFFIKKHRFFKRKYRFSQYRYTIPVRKFEIRIRSEKLHIVYINHLDSPKGRFWPFFSGPVPSYRTSFYQFRAPQPRWSRRKMIKKLQIGLLITRNVYFFWRDYKTIEQGV